MKPRIDFSVLLFVLFCLFVSAPTSLAQESKPKKNTKSPPKKEFLHSSYKEQSINSRNVELVFYVSEAIKSKIDSDASYVVKRSGNPLRSSIVKSGQDWVTMSIDDDNFNSGDHIELVAISKKHFDFTYPKDWEEIRALFDAIASEKFEDPDAFDIELVRKIESARNQLESKISSLKDKRESLRKQNIPFHPKFNELEKAAEPFTHDLNSWIPEIRKGIKLRDDLINRQSNLKYIDLINLKDNLARFIDAVNKIKAEVNSYKRAQENLKQISNSVKFHTVQFETSLSVGNISTVMLKAKETNAIQKDSFTVTILDSSQNARVKFNTFLASDGNVYFLKPIGFYDALVSLNGEKMCFAPDVQVLNQINGVIDLKLNKRPVDLQFIGKSVFGDQYDKKLGQALNISALQTYAGEQLALKWHNKWVGRVQLDKQETVVALGIQDAYMLSNPVHITPICPEIQSVDLNVYPLNVSVVIIMADHEIYNKPSDIKTDSILKVLNNSMPKMANRFSETFILIFDDTGISSKSNQFNAYVPLPSNPRYFHIRQSKPLEKVLDSIPSLADGFKNIPLNLYIIAPRQTILLNDENVQNYLNQHQNFIVRFIEMNSSLLSTRINNYNNNQFKAVSVNQFEDIYKALSEGI